MKLNLGEVHIWSASIDESYNKLLLNSYLSENEKERSEMFSFDIDFFIFSVKYNLLRSILGSYLNCHPAAIRFKNNRFQKPYIASPNTSIQFNISVSSNRFVAVFCQYQDIGVDVELIRKFENIRQFTTDQFTIHESDWINSHPDAILENAFFNIWTKKEAIVKAIGEGLNIQLNEFDTLSKSPITFRSDRWNTTPVTLFDDCAASIAINSSTTMFTYFNATALL